LSDKSVDDPWRFRRDALGQHYLSLLLDAPRRPLALFGPRQVGKTFLLTHDLTEAASAAGLRPIYVDLWAQAAPLDAINTALAGALRAVTTARRRTPVTQVGAMGASLGLAAPQALQRPDNASAWMVAQFDELQRLQPRPSLMMLDEAQSLGRGAAGEAAMKAVRALFNSRPGELLLLLTGSSRQELLSLVGDHSKVAFKLAAQMDFPLLGTEFVAFVRDRYVALTKRKVAIAELDWAFGELEHRPGELIDLVRFWITDRPGAALEVALKAYRERSRPDAGPEALIRDCTPLQQNVLAAIVRGESLYAEATRQGIAVALGLGPPLAPGSVGKAVTGLLARQLLRRRARGQYEIVDERLRQWLTAKLAPPIAAKK